MERDETTPQASEEEEISTHTLTWSVTNNVAVATLQPTISTHTLTWSVTILQILTLRTLRFQLTRSRGA